MSNLTLKELIDKLNDLPTYYKIDPEKEMIQDAWVAGSKDKDYPPGTILFECTERNTLVMTPEDIHILSVYPSKLGKLQ